MARPRRRRLLVAVVLLGLLALGGGVAYVLGVGRSRTDPFRQAAAALKAGNVADAEALLRSVLQADPADARARSLLIQVLADRNRVAEAEDLAKTWLADPDTEATGLRALSQLAFRRGDAAAAVRLARRVAERDPAFSQAMLVQVQDLRGAPADLEGSVRAAEGLGLLAKSPEVRAGAFLYAAETLRQLERTAPEGPRRSAYAERRERNRQEALRAASTSAPRNTLPSESPGATRARRARIQLLSTDAIERHAALETLERLLLEEPDLHDARAALVDYLATDGQIDQALAHARHLGGSPAVSSMRAVASLLDAGARAGALDVLSGATSIPPKARDVLRARILLGGDAAERGEGARAFEVLVRESPSDVDLAREAYSRIRAGGDPARALRLLEDAATREPKLNLPARVEAAAAASEAAAGAALDDRLTAVASATGSSDLVGVFSRLYQVPKVGESTAFAFLDKVIQAKKIDANEVRLLRVAATASRAGAAPDGRTFGDWTRDDLAAIAADPGAPAEILVRAATLAVVADERRTTGTLLARVLIQPTARTDAVSLYVRTMTDPDDARRALETEGMRGVATALEPAATWLNALADALERSDATVLRRRSSEGPPRSDRPQPTETLLQLELALHAGDNSEAEAFARVLLGTTPPIPQAVERLGAVLLRAGKWDEVLALHAGAALSPLQRAQRVQALQRLDRRKEALAEARLFVKESEGADAAIVLLGLLLREQDPDAALAAVSSAAGNAAADALRAELLEQRGQEDAAVQVYEDMLRASGDRSLAAWHGLARVRAAQGRDWKFIDRVTSIVEAPPRGLSAVDTASLFRLRGQANERTGAYERAFRDYLRVLEVAPKDVVALNNAAWLLCDQLLPTATDKAAILARALDLADRAAAVAPGVPAVHHTRAKVLVALDRNEDALAAFERAIELIAASAKSQGKAGLPPSDLLALKLRWARYLLDQAVLLEKTGSIERARVTYRRVRDEHPGTYPAKLAMEALARLGE